VIGNDNAGTCWQVFLSNYRQSNPEHRQSEPCKSPDHAPTPFESWRKQSESRSEQQQSGENAERKYSVNGSQRACQQPCYQWVSSSGNSDAPGASDIL
jgi:hypothetical protein